MRRRSSSQTRASRRARSSISSPAPEEPDGCTARYRLRLEPGAHWQLQVAVQWLLNGASPLDGPAFEQQLQEDRRERDSSLDAWWSSVPLLQAGDATLERTWSRSLADLAALRLRWTREGMVPAAGLPWFMTVFGRDSLITSLQELLLGPEPAAATLRALAETQADADDPERDAEPGKIVHEIRRGKTAQIWTDRYYGSVDATPLFLVLLSELWRWSGDDAIVRELEGPARRALAWIDDYGDRDGDGFVEYFRRASHGIDNQNWKDSHNSMVFHDGMVARAPIAAVEVQGYVYDAKLRVAELARRVWRDDETAARLEREAAELRERFDAAFWVPERGWYALGLDAEKRQIDALASNMGHLLWSGIVPQERIAAVAERLTSGQLWSGWGVRTLAADEAGVRPARVPQRHGLASRQFPDRARAGARRSCAGRSAGRACAARHGRLLRRPSARAVRGLRAEWRRAAGGGADVWRARRRGRPGLPFFCSAFCSSSSRTPIGPPCVRPRTACPSGRRDSRWTVCTHTAAAGACRSATGQRSST